jgi:histidine kinase
METNYRKFTDPQDAGRVFRAFNNVYVSHKPSREFEWQIIRKDGEKRHLEASVSLIKGPDGLANGFQGIIRDVTDRNLAEQSLKKAYQELKHTQSQLVQSGKLASIGELAAGVAHELNQPLMVIRGNAQLVKRFITKGQYEIDDLLKQMEPIERNTKRMMNIINHLRAFSRQSKSEYYSLDVNQVIEESFLMVGEQLRLRNIEIKKTLDPALPKIKGDTNQLEQVFLNLITNARDAITEKNEDQKPESGNSDTIEIITQTSQSDPNLIEILFKDSGRGIGESARNSIFDPFFTTKAVGKGTGLGLSISYGIISDHNGQIEIAETGPQGTTFQVKLPIKSKLRNLN